MSCTEADMNTIDMENLVLNNIVNDSLSVCNSLFLITKQYIYRCRCQQKKPQVLSLLEEFKFNYHIEKIIAKESGRFKKFNSRWSPVKIVTR